ncbi:hypothetical protein RZO55_10185 [Clostridium boliviensis]|uniref:DUF2313 domain-containing protein n=1 Tax=Clostridium boliviensis TaxID=318465 RepID=A0ABU4GJZ6_9CLOT|nr:hypothetical protein [Clostridium boliviensis]MDW2797942.1 hypothetical protein [Clostridium boliviensis]
MSAFLGPIHIWLYNKILLQNAMTDAIVALAEEKGWTDGLGERMDSRYGTLETGNLEDNINTDNIHGWLQERVSLVENRLAYAVTTLLEEDPARIDAMKQAVKEFGKSRRPEGNISVKQAYEHLENTLLNGMPCDRVNQLVKEESDLLAYHQAVEIHEPYWDMIHGDVNYYYELREALIEGMFEGLSVQFHHTGNQEYELRSRQ